MAVLGLARSGRAAARWLAGQGIAVYASDAADSAAVRDVAAELAGLGVTVDVGRHDLARIRRAAAAVVSPGVPPGAPPVAAAREAGVEIVAELDLGARALARSRLVVITGTNGKSTTTALVAQLLAAGGLRVEAAGNIGRPLTELAGGSEPEWIAVEASSFQLHDAPLLAPAVGVVTNLAPDHLDRYPDAQAYYEDKRLLFRNADDESTWVLNGDDDAVLELAGGARGRRVLFRLAGPADAWLDRVANRLILDGRPLLPRDELRLLGDHNVANALAAGLAARAAGVPPDGIARGLASFRALRHRLEPLRELNGVLWINDSKATNVAAAACALRAVTRPIVLVAGGRDKGEPFTFLAPLVRQRCRSVVAYGEARAALSRDLGAAAPAFVAVAPFDDAVREAGRRAQAGDAVLLAPACASFDQFDNYEARGDRFRALVEAQ